MITADTADSPTSKQLSFATHATRRRSRTCACTRWQIGSTTTCKRLAKLAPYALLPILWSMPNICTSIAGVRCPHLSSAAATRKQPDLKPSAVFGTDEPVLAGPLQPDVDHSLHLSVLGPHLCHFRLCSALHLRHGLEALPTALGHTPRGTNPTLVAKTGPCLHVHCT